MIFLLKKFTYEEVKSIFESRNCILLTEFYSNASQPLDFICQCGEKSTTSLNGFKKSKACYYCKGKEISKSVSKYSIDLYDYYCDQFVSISKNIGRPIMYKELIGKRKIYDLPTSSWFVAHCPQPVKDFSEFLEYLGFKPRYNISKETATTIILGFSKTLNRTPKTDDFRTNKCNLSVPTISRLWGSFNKMLVDLGFEINQGDMASRHRDIEQLKDDIKRCCEWVYETQNRRVITLKDIDSCEWCLSSQVYTKLFKKELGIPLKNYIEFLGYEYLKPGMGMHHTFEDGEITLSKHEFEFSNLLRNNNIKYRRNVPYNEINTAYVGGMDCDYLVYIDNQQIYIEIAGMINKNKGTKYINKKYNNKIYNKEIILKSSNVQYIIVYGHEFDKFISDFNNTFLQGVG